MKVENMTSPNGNKVANQFIIYDRNDCAEYFQSYDSIIVKKVMCRDKDGNPYWATILDEHYWNYSRTTSKYRSQFLGESTKETQAKIDSGEYILADLNS